MTAPTLPAFLETAYQFSAGIGGVTVDPAAACAAAGFAAGDLTARRDNLEAVRQRCVVSGVQSDFLTRVLALMPAA